jgi:DNA-binding transcriptional LysR family regulator
MTGSPQPPADLDLRMVRYFTVVAGHRHFGRAAADLRVTQSSVSRQVRRLEQDLGVRLFDRTPQGTELTEAGEAFLPRARALLRSAAQAAAAAHAAATSSRIVIGHTTGITVTPPVLKLRQRHPDADVRILRLAWDEPRRALLDHRADAVVCRLPLETRGLHVTILYDEPRMLLVPRDRRLAGKELATLDDTEPGHVVLATRIGDQGRLVAAFVKYARDSLTGPAPDAESPALPAAKRPATS